MDVTDIRSPGDITRIPRKDRTRNGIAGAKPTHNTQVVAWPASRAWQGILRSCRHFIWQFAPSRELLEAAVRVVLEARVDMVVPDVDGVL